MAHGDQFWSFHPGGANFLFADGSVHFIKELIVFRLYQSLAMRRGAKSSPATPIDQDVSRSGAAERLPNVIRVANHIKNVASVMNAPVFKPGGS